MTIIDAHHHIWDIDAPHHVWPTSDDASIFRNFTIGDLMSEADTPQLCAAILVQSQPHEADTRWLLSVARQHPIVQAVVGWTDMIAPDAPIRIADLASDPLLRGLRPMLQSIDDSDWLLSAAIAPAIEAMITHGLRLDALVQPRHLPMLARLSARYPSLPIVIDHAAKPAITAVPDARWCDQMAALAQAGLWCKLSGLRTEQAPSQDADMLAPYVQHLCDHFGQRLMWGSDWPVVHLASDNWGDWYNLCVRLTETFIDQERLFHGAAAEFYSINFGGAD